MALQGTLDTFALADLVRLLATTGKTGELAIDGDRGSGRLWFADGQLVGGEPTAQDLDDVVFALLRMRDGEFAFHADTAPDDVREPQSALDVLAAAEARLEDWRPVEELVPSAAVALTLRAELPQDEVTIGRDVWRRLIAIGGGTTAGAFGADLDLDEQATGFAVRDLVDAGLVEVGDEVDTAEDQPDDVLAVDVPSDDVPSDDVPSDDVAPVVEALALESIAAPALPADEARVPDDGSDPSSAAAPDEAAEVPPVLGVVPDPPYSFGRWGDGPAPTDEAPDDLSALGPWEPLAAAPAPDDTELLPTLDQPEALPSLDALPSLEAIAEPAPPLDEAIAPVDALPSLDAAADEGGDLGSYAVDLDSQLGGSSVGHSYLGTSDTAGGGLPEPLLGVDGVPTSDAAAVSAPPEPPAPSSAPEPGTGVAEEVATARDHATADTGWGTSPDDLGVPLDSLSPAAARALTAAAAADGDDDDTDAGRRILRRIISTGKG